MYSKMIKNDIQKSKLTTATITAFILIAALLTSLAASLIINLLAAIDTAMLKAKTPHFMQMHSGELDNERLEIFANSQSNVDNFQVLEFLNIDGAKFIIGENSLVSSVQDNGLSLQAEHFDFLLDLNGDIIQPAEGEIYVPIYYMKEGQAKIGDKVTVHGVSFTVAGFLRDSVMNSAMISSKRFLVNEHDFEKVRDFGKLEFLIEFRLVDSSTVSDFESIYMESGMESSGPPPITYALFKLANAITDGIMIALLILISILVIVVTFLCIRFTLLTKIENDYREIRVLKAIGLRVSHIKKLYMAKYGTIAAVACVLGFLTSLILKEPLMANIRLYFGESNSNVSGVLFGMIAAVIIFLVVVLYVNAILCRFRKISAAQAIRFGATQEKSKSTKKFLLSKNQLFSSNVFLGVKDLLSRKKLYVTMLFVLIISSFIMIVPQNIYNTISSRNFMTYMGIGNCYMRIDIQQTEEIAAKTTMVTNAISQDSSIAKHTVLTSMMFDMRMDDSKIERLKVELGDHLAFPITYSKGRLPQTENEIALSALVIDDLGKAVGDEIVLIIDGEEKSLSVCGVYSDITNGGKTAKALFKTKQTDILWSIIPITFYDNTLTDKKVGEYREKFSFAKISNIDDYIDQSFGTMVAAIQKASYASIATTILLTILVTLLIMKMLIAKDRYSIAILKSLGFTNLDIRKQYVTRSIVVLVIGIVAGTVLANTLGEVIGTAIISSFGISSLHFDINPLFSYLLSPLVMAVCVAISTVFGVSDIQSLKVSEHIKE